MRIPAGSSSALIARRTSTPRSPISALSHGAWSTPTPWWWVIVPPPATIASVAGYSLLGGASEETVAFIQTFAAGAILTMLADTMMPEAVEHAGRLVGLLTVLGFAVAFFLSAA